MHVFLLTFCFSFFPVKPKVISVGTLPVVSFEGVRAEHSYSKQQVDSTPAASSSSDIPSNSSFGDGLVSDNFSCETMVDDLPVPAAALEVRKVGPLEEFSVQVGVI